MVTVSALSIGARSITATRHWPLTPNTVRLIGTFKCGVTRNKLATSSARGGREPAGSNRRNGRSERPGHRIAVAGHPCLPLCRAQFVSHGVDGGGELLAHASAELTGVVDHQHAIGHRGSGGSSPIVTSADGGTSKIAASIWTACGSYDLITIATQNRSFGICGRPRGQTHPACATSLRRL